MIKQRFTSRKITRAELLVTSVLLLQFMTYLFGIFGNPIKGAFEIGRKVEDLQNKFGAHCVIDSSWRCEIISKFDANAADHASLKLDMLQVKEAVLRPSNRK